MSETKTMESTSRAREKLGKNEQQLGKLRSNDEVVEKGNLLRNEVKNIGGDKRRRKYIFF